jgi:hypothetical protein
MKNKRCNCESPTGQKCTMGLFHAGPHKVGGPYNTTEIFVTPCEGECVFHHNSDEFEEWEECIHCGFIMFL